MCDYSIVTLHFCLPSARHRVFTMEAPPLPSYIHISPGSIPAHPLQEHQLPSQQPTTHHRQPSVRSNTMQLLDLPPELFQHIVHDLVSVVGVSEAWKYRWLCRTFAAEISHDVFAKSDHDMFVTYRDDRLLGRGPDIHLLNRLDSPCCVNTVVLAKTKDMIDCVK